MMCIGPQEDALELGHARVCKRISKEGLSKKPENFILRESVPQLEAKRRSW